jgi:hypothetical protein
VMTIHWLIVIYYRCLCPSKTVAEREAWAFVSRPDCTFKMVSALVARLSFAWGTKLSIVDNGDRLAL